MKPLAVGLGVLLMLVGVVRPMEATTVFTDPTDYLDAITPNLEIDIGKNEAGVPYDPDVSFTGNGDDVFSDPIDVAFSSPEAPDPSLVRFGLGHVDEIGPIGSDGSVFNGPMRIDFQMPLTAFGFESFSYSGEGILLDASEVEVDRITIGSGFTGIVDAPAFTAVLFESNEFWSINGGTADESRFFGVVVPEPSTVVLLATGLGAAVACLWRKRRRREYSREAEAPTKTRTLLADAMLRRQQERRRRATLHVPLGMGPSELRLTAGTTNGCQRQKDKQMKNSRVANGLLGTFLVALVLGPATPRGLAGEIDPLTGPSGGNTIDWYYWSPLTVLETITDLGGGSHRYEYSFLNVDTSPIWHFLVYTTFVTQGGAGGTEFAGHASWRGPRWASIHSVLAEYDARNLDPDILGATTTWTEPWPDPLTAIQLGEAASGYSFVASTYDPSPKYYGYETIASGYTRTNGTGKVAAVGLTIPEPATVWLLLTGALALLPMGAAWHRVARKAKYLRRFGWDSPNRP